MTRWIKPDGNVIPADIFIPYAENSGLIIPITEQVFYKAVQDLLLLDWQDGTRFISFNIVPDHLTNKDLFNLVKSSCDKYQITPSAISFEITERHEIPDLAKAKSVLDDFYQLGIGLKLDDAGTGYGGFSYIQELGITTLKIDKMFIDAINSSDDSESDVLDAIISFVKASNLTAIAEGVESQLQIDYLTARGVYHIQGYFYCPPLPFSQFTHWLNR